MGKRQGLGYNRNAGQAVDITKEIRRIRAEREAGAGYEDSCIKRPEFEFFGNT